METVCLLKGKGDGVVSRGSALTCRCSEHILYQSNTVQQVLVTGLHRESGVNPERTRHCDSEPSSELPLGLCLRRQTKAMTSSQETCLRITGM